MALVDHQSVHQHALETLAEADALLACTPHLELDGVHTIDKVDPEWLSKTLGLEIPGAVVEELSIVGAHEGMTSRHKWKLVWNREGQEADLPATIFIKATPDDPHLRQMLSVIHMGELEAHVYNDLQQEFGDFIPKAYYSRSYPGGRFIIIMEDLEERGIKPYWFGDSCPLQHARAVAVTQAKMHAKFWDSERFESDLIWVRPRTRRFGELWMRKYFSANRQRFLEMDAAKNLPVYVQNLVKDWDENCLAVHDYWETRPQTFLHGDPHLGNSLGFADGRAGFYDWQCLFRGYGYRDLAYFLMSALTSEDYEAHEKEIFDLYTDTLEQNGVKVNREEAWLDYCLFVLDSLDASISTLTNTAGYGHAQHGLERHLNTLSATLQRHDVAALLRRVVETGSV
ncbi:MAG: hypothetical protein M1818_006344 [Claussenomyces sp. TS43310]|nr:MAG: hypothetical protein M1818_006344 [Claussenomyces sp. TS43310]